MTIYSLNDPIKLIKHLIKLQEALSENLEKMSALLYVALEENFLANPLSVIHHYLFSINHIIENSLGINEEIMNNLIRSDKLFG